MTERSTRKPRSLSLQLALTLCLMLFAACAGILGIRKQPSLPFPHRKHVLNGVSCVQCHAATAMSDASSAIDLPGTASCTSCHDKPHDTRACAQCHGREDERAAVVQAKEHLRFSHKQHAPSSAGCTRCHDRVASEDGSLRPSMASCLSCHQHQQAWTARSCSPCHVRMETEGTRPESHVVHGTDFMKRHGTEAASARDLCSSCHRDSDCTLCHGVNVPVLPSRWHFEDVRRPDMHAQGFLARHSLEAKIDPALCASCHRDQSSCRACHQDKGLLQLTQEHGSPHPAGWVGTRGTANRHGIEARQDPVACASCHGGAGESLCVGCHRVGGAGGNPHPPGFHSQKPLSDLPCRMCHMGGI